jgi:putative tricarboxylic transport membrane protein
MTGFDQLVGGFAVALSWKGLLYCFIGCLWGTIVGVLPGLGPLAGMTLLLPLTFGLDPAIGIIMLTGIFYGAMYGGSTTSILVRIPGEAASVVTCLDGHQMARQGRAGAALGMAAIGSFIAGTLSLIALTFFAPVLTTFALKFGPPENFALMVLGLVCTVFMIQGSVLKAIMMIALGFVVAAVGIDVVNGRERFAFGSVNLSAGAELVAIVMGLFGVSEILLNVEELAKSEVVRSKIRDLWPGREDWRASWAPILRGTGLGFLLGILPGGGPVTAAFMSYAVEKRVSRHPEKFGTGTIEGVAGPESANNAAVAGSMIPLLSLGLPANAVTALLLGALIIQGVQPGPLLMVQRPDLFWGVVASMYVGNVFLLILNLPLVGLWVQLLRVPYKMLFPMILLLTVVGTYTTNKNLFDLWVMLGFGVFGYALRKLEYDMAPLILSIVLAPLLEQSLRQSMVMSQDGAQIFFARPVSATLLAVSALLLLLVFVRKPKGGAPK